MKINLTVPTTSNKLELFVKISGGLEESPWEVGVDGTPFISVYISWIENTYGYSIVLASPDQSKPLSDYTTGAVSLIGIVPAGQARTVSAVCLTNQQDLTQLRIIAQAENENYTSTLYPASFEDAFIVGLAKILREKLIPAFQDFAHIPLAGLLSGELHQVLQTYTLWAPEELNVSLAELQSGKLLTILREYSNWPDERLGVRFATIDAGFLQRKLISYQNWVPESLGVPLANINSGTLT